MARQTDCLPMIGLEDFTAIDEHFGLAKRFIRRPAAMKADRLAKIGLEGFAAIDEHFGRAKRRPVPVLKIPNGHQANLIPATEVIDSNEAAQRYKRRVYIDYPKGKPVPF